MTRGLATALIIWSMAAALRGQYSEPRTVASVAVPGLRESSGLAASRRVPGVFWSHNDSGGGTWIYAIDRNGKGLGRWRVRNAKPSDWEAMSAGPGPRSGVSYLYIGDIGDNQRKRKDIAVYRLPEPDPRQADKPAEAAEVIRLRYPDEPHDAEALLVHPRTGDIYVVTKAKGVDLRTKVLKARVRSGTRVTMQHVADLDLPGESPLSLLIGRVTGGDISPDGSRVVLCSYFSVWEAVVPAGSSFDAVWKSTWRRIEFEAGRQREAITYRHDGAALVTTTEGTPFRLVEAVREERAATK